MRKRDRRSGSPRHPGVSTIWIVEDNTLYRQMVARLIDDQSSMQCALAVASCEEALERLDQDAAPDVVIMDIGLPGQSGIEGARHFAERAPSTRVVILTVHEERQIVFDAIVAGASGYVLKSSSADEIVGAIENVLDGAAPINAYIARKVLDLLVGLSGPRADYALTPRETEILQLMVDGLTMPAIAARLEVSYYTIDTHVRHIYRKLHVHSATGAVAKAIKERLI